MRLFEITPAQTGKSPASKLAESSAERLIHAMQRRAFIEL
jgi:hypothetical protein